MRWLAISSPIPSDPRHSEAPVPAWRPRPGPILGAFIMSRNEVAVGTVRLWVVLATRRALIPWIGIGSSRASFPPVMDVLMVAIDGSRMKPFAHQGRDRSVRRRARVAAASAVTGELLVFGRSRLLEGGHERAEDEDTHGDPGHSGGGGRSRHKEELCGAGPRRSHGRDRALRAHRRGDVRAPRAAKRRHEAAGQARSMSQRSSGG